MSRAGLRRRLSRPVGRRAGIALIVVAVTLAILGAVMADFAFNAQVDYEAAANARDQLRAEYLARSGIQLSRLLIKVQQSVIDKNRQFIGDLQITEFAPYLMRAFGGASDEREGIGALLGFDVKEMKGLGVGKGASFDVEMGHEDGKLNLNCGGGLNDTQRQRITYGVLAALMWPPRYNRLFERADAEGQYHTRDNVVRAILDWADVDQARFEPIEGGSSGPEDYKYDVGRDPYKAHDHLYDTVEEVNLVRGVGDAVWGSFGEMFTVYGGCKINVSAIKPEHWPLMTAILRATVKDDQKNNAILLDDVTLAALSQQVLGMSKLTGGFQTTQQFVSLVTNPAAALGGLAGAQGGSSGSSQIQGIPLDPNKVGSVITVGPRRVYRIDSTGTIERPGNRKVQVHVRAVWDTMHFNQNTTSQHADDRVGTWLYWRQD